MSLQLRVCLVRIPMDLRLAPTTCHLFPGRRYASAYVSIRQHTSAYVAVALALALTLAQVSLVLALALALARRMRTYADV